MRREKKKAVKKIKKKKGKKKMKTNAGFEIMKEEKYTDKSGIALGYNVKSTFYVTWEFTEFEDNTTSYYWGHYFEDEKTAITDYHKRLTERYEDIPF